MTMQICYATWFLLQLALVCLTSGPRCISRNSLEMLMKVLNGLKACPALSRLLLPRRVHSFILSLSSPSRLSFTGLRCQAFNVMCLEMLPISLVSRDATCLSDLKMTLNDVGEFKVKSSCISHVVLVFSCKRERTTVRAPVPCQSSIPFCRTVRLDTLQTKP